jgi:hypothetical protein
LTAIMDGLEMVLANQSNPKRAKPAKQGRKAA